MNAVPLINRPLGPKLAQPDAGNKYRENKSRFKRRNTRGKDRSLLSKRADNLCQLLSCHLSHLRNLIDAIDANFPCSKRTETVTRALFEDVLRRALTANSTALSQYLKGHIWVFGYLFRHNNPPPQESRWAYAGGSGLILSNESIEPCFEHVTQNKNAASSFPLAAFSGIQVTR